jgi:hypothetical protein
LSSAQIPRSSIFDDLPSFDEGTYEHFVAERGNLTTQADFYPPHKICEDDSSGPNSPLKPMLISVSNVTDSSSPSLHENSPPVTRKVTMVTQVAVEQPIANTLRGIRRGTTTRTVGIQIDDPTAMEVADLPMSNAEMVQIILSAMRLFADEPVESVVDTVLEDVGIMFASQQLRDWIAIAVITARNFNSV